MLAELTHQIDKKCGERPNIAARLQQNVFLQFTLWFDPIFTQRVTLTLMACLTNFFLFCCLFDSGRSSSSEVVLSKFLWITFLAYVSVSSKNRTRWRCTWSNEPRFDFD